MRKLVTIRKIGDIRPIPNADAIEVATVDGWDVVVKKGEFQYGDYALYFEIDSILPYGDERFAFLMSRGCKLQPTEDGDLLEGHRLRTIKLRGQVSQGLLLPLPEHFCIRDENDTVDVYWGDDVFTTYSIDDDFSIFFGVKKYEKPIPAQLAGMIAGNFPTWFPKTDQERVQNCWKHIPIGPFSVEEKIEGSSMTIYHDLEKLGVTSRNLDLKLDQEGNTFIDVAKASGILEALEVLALFGSVGRVAIRGELIGPGIQGNIYQLKTHIFHIYDVFVENRYLTPEERVEFIADNLAPYINKNVVRCARTLGILFPASYPVSEILAMADGQSELYPTKREGLVFKSMFLDKYNQVFSFKAISNAYLLGEKDE